MDSIETKHLIIVFIPTVLAFLFHTYKNIETAYVQISSVFPSILVSHYYH